MENNSQAYDFAQMWDYQNPAESERKFRERLAEATDRPQAYRLELQTQIARTLGLQQKFSAGHAVLDEVDVTIGSDAVAFTRPKVRSLLERGRLHNSDDQKERAKPIFIEAFELANSIGADFYAVDAAHMLAIVEQAESALDWNLRALELARQSKHERAQKWAGSLFNNIGWTYHDMAQYEQALDLFQEASAWQNEHGSVRNQRVADWCVARTLRSLGRIDEALAAQQAMLAIYQKEGSDAGYVNEEIGECLLLLARPDEARPFFAEAHRVLSQDMWLVRNESDRLTRLQQLGGKDD